MDAGLVVGAGVVSFGARRGSRDTEDGDPKVPGRDGDALWPVPGSREDI